MIKASREKETREAIRITSWDNYTTWSKVSEKMLSKMDSKKYKLTIDINKWNMEVKVY